MEKKGLFIVIEGGDACGKTTFAEQLEKVLIRHGLPTHSTRLPGGDSVGEAIREILVNSELSEDTRAILFAANRSHLSERVFKPLLDRGVNVICTRWRWSTDVYQGKHLISDHIDQQTDLLVPDIYILLETTDEVMSGVLDKRNPEHPDYDPNGPVLDLMDQVYTKDYLAVKERYRAAYDGFEGCKYKVIYNTGEPKPPTIKEFMVLCEDLLAMICADPEEYITRTNLLTRPNYTPYCGVSSCFNRLSFNGKQFECNYGHYTTEFPDEFIEKYKNIWHNPEDE